MPGKMIDCYLLHVYKKGGNFFTCTYQRGGMFCAYIFLENKSMLTCSSILFWIFVSTGGSGSEDTGVWITRRNRPSGGRSRTSPTLTRTRSSPESSNSAYESVSNLVSPLLTNSAYESVSNSVSPLQTNSAYKSVSNLVSTL
jgi:hypothetical protein